MMRLTVALVAVFCAALASCNWLPGPMAANCDAKTVREFPSPDGKRKAIEYHSTCDEGPKPHHSTVEIADADGNHRATAMHATPESQQPTVWPELKVEWKSASELWLTYPARVDAQCISSPPGVAVHCLDGSITR